MFLIYPGQILHRLFWALQVYLDRKLFSCTVNRKKSKQRKFVKKTKFFTGRVRSIPVIQK